MTFDVSPVSEITKRDAGLSLSKRVGVGNFWLCRPRASSRPTVTQSGRTGSNRSTNIQDDIKIINKHINGVTRSPTLLL